MDRPAATDYDAELQRHDAVLRPAWGIQPHEHVLDIGCGRGQTTCAAARMAHAGRAPVPTDAQPVIPAPMKRLRRVGVTGQGSDSRADSANAVLVVHVTTH